VPVLDRHFGRPRLAVQGGRADRGRPILEFTQHVVRDRRVGLLVFGCRPARVGPAEGEDVQLPGQLGGGVVGAAVAQGVGHHGGVPGALETAPAGTRWHAAGAEGIRVLDIAQSIGRHLSLPAETIPADKLAEHFGFLAALIGLDNPVSTAETRRVLGWEPTHPGLLADFDNGDYF
jgi:hypothetical protein